MGPGGSPEHPLRIGSNNRFRERDDVGEIRHCRDRFGVGNLDVGSRFHEAEHSSKPRLIDASGRRNSTEVIDHQRHGQRRELIAERLERTRLRGELYVPLPFLHARQAGQ